MSFRYFSLFWVTLAAQVWLSGADFVRQETARTILALYDSRVNEDPFYSTTHLLAEMPLNHLGLKVRYVDVNNPLPDPSLLTQIRGILMWLESGEMKDPERFLKWAEAAVKEGKLFVLIGDLAFNSNHQGQPTPEAKINQFLACLGLQSLFEWIPITYDVELEIDDPRIVGYERRIAGIIPPFENIRAIDPQAIVPLRVKQAASQTVGRFGRSSHRPGGDLVIITSKGGYVASGYTHFFDEEKDRKSWILNPFEFFRRAFQTEDLPKPDTTTLSGRRIFYSHIDGDGWRNISTVPFYSKDPTISAEVIMKEVLIPFKDLPVTVGPVVADLHPNWFGQSIDRQIARRIFALPHVELGSHTFSHPFDWSFFEDGDPDKEKPYLRKLSKTWQGNEGPRWFDYWSNLIIGNKKQTASEYKEGVYETPRAFAVKPFSLKTEIEEASEYIESLAPDGKKVRVIQWSGNTLPFEEAIRAARLANLENINGGDTRFDRDFASVAWVAPVGRQVGNEYQIYASNSNENTYTDLWRDRYFGFIHLIRTFENTETPIRLKPLNVYYHMYSGEKLSSLNAVIANLRYVRKQNICPVSTSRFSAIGRGFFSAEIDRIGPQVWQIRNHGWLQTIRFDSATFKRVDFRRSRGIIGQKHYQGSLYVALDRSETEPLIALTEHYPGYQIPDSTMPYLVEGRWDVWNLDVEKGRFRFEAQGYGSGILQWKIPEKGVYEVTLFDQKGGGNRSIRSVDESGLLNIQVHTLDNRPVRIEVKRVGD